MRRPSAPLMGEGAYTHIDPMFSVEADTPGCPPLPLWDNSPSVLIVPHILFQGGISPPAGGEPLLERSKRGEKIAGGRLRRAPSGALSRLPPGPRLRGELGSEARRKDTGAGWPLTQGRSPARCHCAAVTRGPPVLPASDAPPLVLPRGAAGIRRGARGTFTSFVPP